MAHLRAWAVSRTAWHHSSQDAFIHELQIVAQLLLHHLREPDNFLHLVLPYCK